MQENKHFLYQCYTCNKQFPCRPSLDRHTIGHDLEVFASWTKVENGGISTANVHIPPHKKLALDPVGNEMNGNFNPGQVYIKPEVRPQEQCAYQHTNPHPQYPSDLEFAQKPAVSQHSLVPQDSSIGTSMPSAPPTTQTEQGRSKSGTKASKKSSQPRRPQSPSQIKVKSFFCDECERSYTRRDHLNRHKLVHTGERPFVCLVCMKSFIRKDKLQRHEKIHGKEQEHFDCQICGKTFGRKDGLNKHYMAHKMGTVGKQEKNPTSQPASD